MKIWGSERTASFSVKTLNSCNFEVRIRQNCIYLIKDAFALMCVLRSLCKLLNNILINVRESVFAINFRAVLHKEENSSISIIKAFNIFVIVQFIEFFSAPVMFLSLGVRRLLRGSCFIHIYRFSVQFSFGFFFTYGKHIFPIEFDWTSLAPPPLSLSPTPRSSVCFIDIASLPLLLCFILFPEKKKTRIQDDGVTCFDIMWQSL